MYCLLVTGIPAAGKTTLAHFLAKQFHLPVISKDQIKEVMYDDIGFKSREEKCKLGVASMNIMYYMASQLMKINQPFILENNFENSSREGLMTLLERYGYKAVTITLTGDYQKIYERFIKRNASPNRHRGHVVNDCYPEKVPAANHVQISYESFVESIKTRGMDQFIANGPHIIVDTTDFTKIDREVIVAQIRRACES